MSVKTKQRWGPPIQANGVALTPHRGSAPTGNGGSECQLCHAGSALQNSANEPGMSMKTKDRCGKLGFKRECDRKQRCLRVLRLYVVENTLLIWLNRGSVSGAYVALRVCAPLLTAPLEHGTRRRSWRGGIVDPCRCHGKSIVDFHPAACVLALGLPAET